MEQPNVLQQLGLPPTFAPVPAIAQFAKIGAPGPDGVQTLHVMLLDTPIGRLGFAFDADSFRKLGEAIIQQATGLTLASTVPPNGNGERRNGQ